MGMCVLRQREERLTAYIRSLRLAPNGHHLIPTTLNKKDTRNPIKQKFKVPTLGILLSRTQSNKSNWVLSFKKSFTHDMHNPKGIFGFTHDLILPQHNKLTQFFFSIFTHILYRTLHNSHFQTQHCYRQKVIQLESQIHFSIYKILTKQKDIPSIFTKILKLKKRLFFFSFLF